MITIAKEFRGKGLPLSDLIGVGNIGLLEAAKRFDATKGCRFISYAVWWIRQAMQQALKEQCRIVRIPSHRVDELARINKCLKELEQKLERPPEVHEIAEELHLNPDDIDILLCQSQLPMSFEIPFQKDRPDRCIGDFILNDSLPEMEEHISQEELKKEIQKALTFLTEQEARILCMYYGLKGYERMTLERIGLHFGKTRERMRQIKERALAKLKGKPDLSKKLKEFWNG